MTNKEVVKQLFPDAHIQDDDIFYEVWATTRIGLSIMIGDGLTEEEAWDDAKSWIDRLPEDSIHKPNQDNDPPMCHWCNGTGENTSGTGSCRDCKGTGVQGKDRL